MGFEFKVVVAGSFAAGKTTLIQSVSDAAVVGTEVATSGAEAAVKATTTVGVEFGTFKVPVDDADIALHLFGVPGQQRFSAMWEIIAQGMDGLIVLVDGSRPESWDDARGVAQHFASRTDTPVVVGVNRLLDELDAGTVAVAVGMPAELAVEVDVRDQASVRSLLVHLLAILLDRVDEELID